MLYTLSVYGCSMNKKKETVKQEELCPECGSDALVKRWDTFKGKGKVYVGCYCFECDYVDNKERDAIVRRVEATQLHIADLLDDIEGYD